MNSITIEIKAPELAAALNTLASALQSRTAAFPSVDDTAPALDKKASEKPENSSSDASAAKPEKSEIQYTIEDVRTAFSDFARAKGKDKARELLAKYGASKVTALDSKDYPAIMDSMEGEYFA